jgi:hypothetical protein
MDKKEGIIKEICKRKRFEKEGDDRNEANV